MTDLEQPCASCDIEWPATPDIAAAVRAIAPRRAEAAAPARAGAPARLADAARLRRRAAADRVSAARWPSRPTRARPCCAGSASRASRSARSRRGRCPGRARPRASAATLDELRASEAPCSSRPRSAIRTPCYSPRCPTGPRRRRCCTPTAPILVQTFRASATPFIEKTIGSGAATRAADRRRRAGVLDQGRARLRLPSRATAAPTTSSGSRATRCWSTRRRRPAADRGRAQPRARGRDRAISSVTGPAASSPAARSDAPCGAAPPPTGRSGSAVKISSRVGGSMIHASSASSSSS